MAPLCASAKGDDYRLFVVAPFQSDGTTIVRWRTVPGDTHDDEVSHYLLSSHDGYGLGHVRRSVLIARALLTREPQSTVTLVTGVDSAPSWLSGAGIEVVRVPPLVKDSDGSYRNSTMAFEDAVAHRAEVFDTIVRERRPDAVLIDRHPFGTGGELRSGVRRAREQGAAVVLGLRDVLDEPTRIHAEIAGDGWRDVAELFSAIFVYGDRALCDHNAEYGLPLKPRYCGWVTAAPAARAHRDEFELVIAAGGGGDGESTIELGAAVVTARSPWRGTVLAGPYADQFLGRNPSLRSRITVIRNVDGCAPYFARAGAVIQMAGYNSTAEAIAAGCRPILVPRRSPRREQAIRASRLAALGLADVVDEGADAAEVGWILDRPRTLAVDACERAGIRLDGAARAAKHLARLVRIDASS
jgi:predicted glycosyltransferase